MNLWRKNQRNRSSKTLPHAVKICTLKSSHLFILFCSIFLHNQNENVEKKESHSHRTDQKTISGSLVVWLNNTWNLKLPSSNQPLRPHTQLGSLCSFLYTSFQYLLLSLKKGNSTFAYRFFIQNRLILFKWLLNTGYEQQMNRKMVTNE